MGSRHYDRRHRHRAGQSRRRPQGAAGQETVLCLSPVGRVWPDQLAAALGTYAATVDDHIPCRGRGFRSRAHPPDECGVHSAQQGRRAPFVQALPRRGAANPVPRGPRFPPSHAFTQKEPRRFDHRLGGAARATLIAARPLDLLDQTSHQAACRRSHRALSRLNAQKSWAHAVSPAAAAGAKNTYLPPAGF
jgi:hypothetical protein